MAFGLRSQEVCPCFVRSRTTMPVINTQAANSSPGDVVREMLKERSADAVSHRSRAIVAVLAFPLFLDYFLYGLLFTLPAHSRAGVEGEGHVALLYGVYAISVLLVTPLFGYLGDRFGSRSTMICGAALAVVAVSLFGLAPSFLLLVLGKVCQGAASAALWTSGLALVAANYIEKRVVMLGYAFAAGTFGSVIGPVAGGLLYQAGAYKLPFFLIGIAFAAAIGLIVRLVPVAAKQQHEPVDLRALVLSRSISVPAVTIALAAFSFGIIEPLLPVRLARHGLPSIAIGTIFAVSTLVYGLSAPWVGRVSERLPVHQVTVLGTIGMAAILPFLAVFKGAISVGITLSLVNVAFAFMLNPASAELGDVVDRSGLSCYSAVYAVYNIFYSIGMLSTAALASSATRLLSFPGVLLCASAVLLLSVLFLAKAGHSKSRAPRHPGNNGTETEWARN
jgi:MFS transporter, DHA1 family, solute carrier family 18 (vesicular amine transporter), member 1/2